MRSNLFWHSCFSLLLLSCSSAKTEEDAVLENTIEAAMIGAQGGEDINIGNDSQADEQQDFNEEQQDFDDQQNLNEEQDADDMQVNNDVEELPDDVDTDAFDDIAGQQNAADFSIEGDALNQQVLEQQTEDFSNEFEENNTQMLLDEEEPLQQASPTDDMQSVMAVSDDDSMAMEGETTETAEIETTPMAVVHWIGYVYKAEESLVNVEIVTKHSPKFDIYQELNQAKQKEIVVRYYDTRLRQKMRRAIDASEFRSPVAYIRTRDGDEDGIVEIVLTIRDEVETKYLAEDNKLLLSFPIPKRYFGRDEVAAIPAEQAVDLSTPLIVVEMEDSQMPRAGKVLGYVFNRAVFNNVDADTLQALPDDTLSFNNGADMDANAMPADVDSMLVDDGNNNEQAEFEQNQQENFQQEEFEQNQQQNIQQHNQQNFQQNQQEQFQQNQQNDEEEFEQNFQQNDEEQFEQNVQENAALGKAVLFWHVGQDPADNFSAPESISDGSKDAQGLPVANNTDEAQGNAANNSAAPPSPPANEGGLELEMGQVTENSLNNNATLGEELLDEDSLLAPLHGTESIGQEDAAEGEANSEVKAIRMVFRDAPLSEVLHAIRTETGTNFIFTPAVGAIKIFLNLSNVPWDEALTALLEVNNLAMVKMSDNLVRIDSLAAIESYKKQKESLKIQEGRLEPTKVMILKLAHAKIGVVRGIIGELLKKITDEDKRVKVVPYGDTNSLLIEALPKDLAKIRALVERLDVRPPQIRIASRVVEVSKSTANIFGISWSGPINYDRSRGLGFGSLIFPNFMTANFAIDASGGGGGLLDSSNGGGSIGVHFGSLNDSIALDLRLQMLETQNDAEILQTNNVVVENKVGASISAGSNEIIITPGSGEAGNTVTTVNNTVTLNVTPEVKGDDAVQMQITINSTTPRPTTNTTASDTRTINTKLLKKSGETIAIGGLYTLNKTKSTRGVPYLSSIPIIGALFRSLSKAEGRKELLFLVTPTILHAGVTDEEDEFGEQGNIGNNLSNNVQQNEQFQQDNQFQQDQNFNVEDINAENPSNADWQDNNDQFQQQQGQQDNQQNFEQNNEQLNDEQFNDEQINEDQLNEDQLNDEQFNDEQINLNEEENDDEQQEEALTIDQQQDLGDQF